MASIFISEMIRYFTGFLWIAAVAGKLQGFAQFRDNLGASFGLPPRQALLAAPAVVLLEALVAALVLGGHDAGMFASFLLMSGLTAVVLYKYLTTPVVRCSCFGKSSRPLSPFDVLRNLLVVLAIAGHMAFAPSAGLAGNAWLAAAGFGAVLCVAAIHFHDTVRLLGTD